MKVLPESACLILGWFPAQFGLKFVISTSFEEPHHEHVKDNCGTSQQQRGSEFRESRSQPLAQKTVLNFPVIHFFHIGTLSIYLQSLLHLVYFCAFLVNVCVTQHA